MVDFCEGAIMTEQERLKADTRSAVLKALAHSTRIYIVDVIDRDGPRRTAADAATFTPETKPK